MTLSLVTIAVFIGVSSLVGGVAIMFRDGENTVTEKRLEVIAGLSTGNLGVDSSGEQGILATPLVIHTGILGNFIARLDTIKLLFQQADTLLTLPRFLLISTIFGVGGAVLFSCAGIPLALVPLMGILAGLVPLFWLLFRRRRRLRKFASQLPDALELIARALRAGHSLAAGFNLAAGEMTEPIGKEFGRVFEEQNLGIPLDEALESMTRRIPNLDLKFFATAVILQRKTGGDLAEILDKIGELIRERFRIWGQVQALTGEGRLSGLVLLGLPPLLFLAVWRLNADYVMPLFTEPMGQKMLAVGIVMQIIGALVIRKIVNIKV